MKNAARKTIMKDVAGPHRAILRALPLAVAACVILVAAGAAPGQASRPGESARSAGAVPATAPSAADAERAQPLPSRKDAAGTATVSGGPSSAPASAPSNTLDSIRVAVALAVVLLIIFAVQKTWKKLGMPGMSGRSSELLQVVTRMNVSPRQQVLVLRIGRRCVVVANNGSQMNPLCEITDPEEVALLIGQQAAQRSDSSSASFNAVLGSAEQEFEQEAAAAAAPAAGGDPEDHEMEAARQEINGLRDRVRDLSKQFTRK